MQQLPRLGFRLNTGSIPGYSIYSPSGWTGFYQDSSRTCNAEKSLYLQNYFSFFVLFLMFFFLDEKEPKNHGCA